MRVEEHSEEVKGSAGTRGPTVGPRPFDRVPATNHFRFIQWDITSRCNLACIHCRSESFYGDRDLERDLSLDAVKSRLDVLYERGIRRIHFLGGEPFSRRDLPEIVSHATKQGIICSINTNGTLIDDERAHAIVEAGVFLLTFSIDGCDAATNDRIRGRGSFERIMRGVDAVKRARVRSGARTRMICCHVLMRPNFDRAEGMIDLCTEIGLDNLIYTNLRKMGGGARSYDELALTEAEKLDVAERIARRLNSGRHCHVQIDIVSLLAKLYLNARYRLELFVERSGCDAVTGKGYAQPDGALFPCQDLATEIGKSDEREAVKSEGVSSLDSTRFNHLPRFLASRETYRRYVPCYGCPALARLCTPCPLPAIRGGAEHNQRGDCVEALRRAKANDIDLRTAIDEAVGRSAQDRLLQDAGFRQEFLTTGDAGLLVESCRDDRKRNELVALRESVLAELQSCLEEALDLEPINSNSN